MVSELDLGFISYTNFIIENSVLIDFDRRVNPCAIGITGRKCNEAKYVVYYFRVYTMIYQCRLVKLLKSLFGAGAGRGKTKRLS
jgi:hypothetical protein